MNVGGMRERAFLWICFLFSALLLIMSLRSTARVAELREGIGVLEAESAAVEEENQILRVQLLQKEDLTEIEQFAVLELGMRQPLPEQIIVLPAPEP